MPLAGGQQWWHQQPCGSSSGWCICDRTPQPNTKCLMSANISRQSDARRNIGYSKAGQSALYNMSSSFQPVIQNQPERPGTCAQTTVCIRMAKCCLLKKHRRTHHCGTHFDIKLSQVKWALQELDMRFDHRAASLMGQAGARLHTLGHID